VIAVSSFNMERTDFLLLLLLTHALSVKTESTSTEPPRKEIKHPFAFKAYDCSQPTDVKDWGFKNMNLCEAKESQVVQNKEKTYQILQSVKHHRTEGYNCALSRTQIARYCGNADHQTALPHLSSYDIPVLVTKADCKRWHDTLKFTDKRGNSHDLQMNALTFVKYEELGSTTVGGGQVSCNGQDLNFNNEIIHQMMMEVQYRITIRNDTYLTNQKEVFAHMLEQQLPCVPTSGFCETTDVTHIWTVPDFSCDLAVVRTAIGQEVTNDNGDVAFMSTDGSLVRLIKKTSVSKCGRIVHSTNHDNLFMYEHTLSAELFDRNIEPGEMEIPLFVKNRDDFLYNHLADALTDELKGLLRASCEQEHRFSKLDFWLQHRDPGLTTWYLENDTFATTAGEALYQYRCQPVEVIAKHLPDCYQALPVQRMAKDGTILESTTQEWMEPLTRRLTTAGVQVPCLKMFLPKYKTLYNQWMAATPEPMRSPPPEWKVPAKALEHHFFRNRPDFSVGGIYDSKQIAAWQRYLDLSRSGLHVTSLLVMQMNQHYKEYPGHYIRAEQLFPDMNDPTQWTSRLWSRTVVFLHLWGETAAILFGLLAMYRMAVSFLSWLYTVVVLREVHGCSRALFWTPCPDIFLLRQYKEVNKAQDDEHSPVRNDLDHPAGPAKKRPRVEQGPTAPYAWIYPSTENFEQQKDELCLLPGANIFRPISDPAANSK